MKTEIEKLIAEWASLAKLYNARHNRLLKADPVEAHYSLGRSLAYDRVVADLSQLVKVFQ